MFASPVKNTSELIHSLMESPSRVPRSPMYPDSPYNRQASRSMYQEALDPNRYMLRSPSHPKENGLQPFQQHSVEACNLPSTRNLPSNGRASRFDAQQAQQKVQKGMFHVPDVNAPVVPDYDDGSNFYGSPLQKSPEPKPQIDAPSIDWAGAGFASVAGRSRQEQENEEPSDRDKAWRVQARDRGHYNRTPPTTDSSWRTAIPSYKAASVGDTAPVQINVASPQLSSPLATRGWQASTLRPPSVDRFDTKGNLVGSANARSTIKQSTSSIRSALVDSISVPPSHSQPAQINQQKISERISSKLISVSVSTSGSAQRIEALRSKLAN